MDKLLVIKIGGNIIDDEKKLSSFLQSFAAIAENKILVHGGGKLATNLANRLGIEQKMVEGRRITDEETLKIVTMVYAGYISKNIVAQLQSYGCNAMGLTGADGNLISAHKRNSVSEIDYGLAGDIDKINAEVLERLFDNDLIPVLSPITHDGKGQLLNTNADTIAQEIAKELANNFDVELIYCFEKAGVLLDVNDENTVIKKLTREEYQELKSPKTLNAGGKIFSGMIPKLDNAFTAIDAGVKKVVIGKAEQLLEIISGKAGTTIVNE